LAEGARARKLSGSVPGVKSLIEGTRLVNDWILTHVLFALWDSGFYEYSLTHPKFQVERAAEELNLDAMTLKWVLEFLVGRGIVESTDGQMGLTEHGARLSNILLRGTMNLYIGGWGPQLASIGPLLRKDITQEEYRHRRSGFHTVLGTEQLSSVRTTPAVLKVLTQRKLQNFVHLACRTGQFMIELGRQDPNIQGIGVDKVDERVVAAVENARAAGLDSRLKFVTAEVGKGPLPLDPHAVAKVEVVIALFLLHEVARYGRQAVLDMLRQIQQDFPGRLFLFMETLPYEPPSQAPGQKPPQTFTQLDYLLIHRVRGQGLPLPPAEWKAMLTEAGLELVEMQEVYWSALYLVQL
jgi:hypothetical protein